MIGTFRMEEAVEHADLIFYITFKGLPVARVGEDGEHVERRVIIRTFEDPSTGYFTLMGGFGFSVGEDTSHRRPMTRPQSIDEICAEQKRLDFTPPPCPPTYMADWWKS
ncbi:UPF0725 protein [Raphanus sativus]|nr:UPF0725 protein [Raphanus sativus]